MNLKHSFLNKVILIVFVFNYFFLGHILAQENDYDYYTYEKSKIRFCANYFTSIKSNWIALDLELSSIEPIHKIKYFKDGIWHTKIHRTTQGSAVGQLGVEYNIENNNFGIRMGAYNQMSLFSFNPVQFIYNTGKTTKGFTYRPEIGIGFWIFQLNYGYNINFKKEITVMGKHLVVFKIHFPF